jgi:hypothetical protein
VGLRDVQIRRAIGCATALPELLAAPDTGDEVRTVLILAALLVLGWIYHRVKQWDEEHGL